MEYIKKMRVLIVDGLPLTRFALSSLINVHAGLTVCGEAKDAPEARRRCEETKPDLIVLDVMLPRGDGLSLLKEFRQLHSPVKAIVTSEIEELSIVLRAFKAGAWAYVSKKDEASELVSAIDAVMAGRRQTSQRIQQQWLQEVADGAPAPATEGLSSLSNRELHIFRLLGRGYGATAIAEELSVSVKTVETHQARIKEKLKIRSCKELRNFARLRAEPQETGFTLSHYAGFGLAVA